MNGREEVVAFLRRKWVKEYDYRLRKMIWAFTGNRIAVRFEYEWHDEAAFIASRDSFYMATTNSDGWPYLQHRGGPAGFLKVIGPHQLGFADFKGNRQLLSTGNLAGDDRVSLFLMDYRHRERLKILGHARVLDVRENAALADQLSPTPELRSKIERLFVIDVVSFDWNCPQYITPRFTEAKVAEAIEPLHVRIGLSPESRHNYLRYARRMSPAGRENENVYSLSGESHWLA